MKILIIEDNPEITSSVEITLQTRWPEAEIITSNFGERGILLAEQQKPNVVILDLGLPDISGYEVLKRIRAFSMVPVLILTVRSREEDVTKGLECGADDFMVKPFRSLELLSRVQALLRRYASYQDLSVINRSSLILSSNFDIQSNYGRFIKELKEVVDINWSAIVAVEGKEILFLAVSSEIGLTWHLKERIAIRGTTVEKVLLEKRTFIEGDLSSDNRFVLGRSLVSCGVRSAASLPLLVGDEVIGCLLLASPSSHAFSIRNVKLLENLASQIALSVENSRLYAQAENKARTDALTGLLNRRALDEMIASEIFRHSRQGGVFSLLAIDVDSLKTFNDDKGHQAGDELLMRVGNIIKAVIRATDRAFRYGGDEFAVILPQTTLDGSIVVAERLRGEIQANASTGSSPITCSIGIASWPSEGITSKDMVRMADSAMYHAKRDGKNRVCLASKLPVDELSVAVGLSDGDAGVLSTVHALAAAVDAKDHYTYGHSKKVSEYAQGIAIALGYSTEQVATIRTAALLHDIGKIGISDDVLTKAKPLAPNDWVPICSHPGLGVDILSHVESLRSCSVAVLYHHERFDGEGYPRRLKGEDIPLDARILAVADAYDAMTSMRPYRPDKMTEEQALAELQLCAGSQFDPVVVDAFVRIMRSLPSPRKTSDAIISSTGHHDIHKLV